MWRALNLHDPRSNVEFLQGPVSHHLHKGMQYVDPGLVLYRGEEGLDLKSSQRYFFIHATPGVDFTKQ